MEDTYSRKAKEFQTLTLFGQCLFMLGKLDKAEDMWNKAESIKILDLSGVDRINFHSILARCYFDAKMFDKALAHLNNTREHLYHQLERGDLNLNVWESMLPTWSYIDGRSIEILLTNKRNKESMEEALVISEAAKGRTLSKMIYGLSITKTPYKLSLNYYKEILNDAKTWLKEQHGRKLLSLFADKSGLAVFSSNEDGSISGQWIEEIRYKQFLKDDYEPWYSIISTMDKKSYDKASKLAEIILDKIGEWLWHCNIDLAQGGEDLIIIPDGPLRNIPLSYCRLPNGKRLSELFNRITTSPSLYDLSQ
jgi:tetratricopeptide (TPR) repeat protein